MQALLALSRVIDAVNQKLGVIADWLVILSCLISAGNAFSRYAFSISSNAWLEIQWYMFGALVLLGASYTLKRNEHVRVDIVYSNISTRRQIWIDIVGGILFLLPATLILAYLSWPVFYNSWALGEVSSTAVGLFFGFIAIEQGLFQFSFMQALPERIFGILSNDTLLAIPFFTLMGAILERCGLAEDLLDGLGQLFGPLRGGLGYAVIVVGAILGAITGTVAASVIAMGLISLPVMMRYGYDMKFATGVIAASGTITQLIPPSLVLIVLADQLGRSVGDMYAGAWGPSLIQVILFSLYVLGVSFVKPQWVPGIPPESRTMTGWPLVKRCLWGIIPSVVLIFLVLGTIFLGLATPTEGGAMGMVGAIVLAVLHRPRFSRFARIASWIALAAITVISLAAYVAMADELAPGLAAAASGFF